MSSISLQDSQISNCVTYVAIVVDESGSINTTEAQQIRDGLTLFINSQAQSNIVLSLIGMSNSDTAVRSDNILEKRISGNQTNFLDWISSFGSGRENVQSDYWASGLNVVKNLAIPPDIVFVISDGMQVNNTTILKELYQNLNQKSHIFSYNVIGDFSEETLQKEVIAPLGFYLQRNPIVKTDLNSAFNTDYVCYSDFSHLIFELSNVLSDLSKNKIGCTTNVEILANNLIYPALVKNKAIDQNVGSLVLKNKGKVPLTLTAGTKIHKSASVNGLFFTIQNTVIIPGLSEIEVLINLKGKALRNGGFQARIELNKVNNPSNLIISFRVGSQPAVIDIDSTKTNLQSTYLQIAAAGSKGIDSTKGIHLRWMLAGNLGKNHLPKGDLYTDQQSASSFNKPDDFVKVYRAPYIKKSTVLDLTQKPNVVDNAKALWIYKPVDSQKSFYIYFKNKTKYLAVKAAIDPLVNQRAFIEAYGNNLIEIENKSDLFFAVELNFSNSSVPELATSGNVKLETLAVAENKITAEKRVTNRKSYSAIQANNIRLVTENGRSIRFKANNCLLNSISFEFYSDFITNTSTNGNWILKGKYGLTQNDAIVFEQLEPKLNAVHGKWLRYNDGEYVNINNYKNKWNKAVNTDDISEENIKEIVRKYIDLSKEATNPTAKDDIPFGDPISINEPESGEIQKYAKNLTEVSYLDLLNIAANDYHIARMLGLGCIDVDDEVMEGEYIYLTEYITFGNLEEDTDVNEVQHLSMSIPTSTNTERFPLPVQLSKIVPGLNVNADDNQPTKITDPEGYSFDGKKRYVNVFMDDVADYDINADFFKSTSEYEGSSFTFPIYAGIDYKIDLESEWRKPELSHDTENRNVNKNLEEASYESVPIIIPESGKSLLNIRQEQTGKHIYIYQGYGINIFSRASAGRQISIESDIRPANNLLSPTGINSLLVTKENPLMFTSQSEQIRYNAITAEDKTLVRILFDYYSAQELLSYTVPKEMSVEDAEKTDTIFPDVDEVFAEHFDFYYKDGLPEAEYGEIKSIDDNDTDNLSSIVKIQEYTTLSTGEKVKIGLNKANKTRFIGGILTIGDQNYVIQNIEVISTKNSNNDDVFSYALVQVLKKEVSESVHSDGDATIDSDQIKVIKIPENRLCTLVQNMQTESNWHDPKVGFQVQVPNNLRSIHREVIQPENENATDLQVEKTRGIWENAIIEEHLEDSYEMDSDGNYKLDENENLKKLSEKKHLGLYKITFPGFNLPEHPQFKQGSENSVEWSNGTVRLFTKSRVREGNGLPLKTRKEFKVSRSENIGTTGDLILYINDTDFKLGNYIEQTVHQDYDKIIREQKVNYYPSYKVYLYADQTSGITEANIQPRQDESTHYSIFGITTNANRVGLKYKSKISVPSPIYAVKIEEPLKPKEIEGDSLYATRPDFYNRSTFTFKTKYSEKRKPYGLLHYRANDEDFLNVLYERATIVNIREELKKLGGNEETYFAARWKNFTDFSNLEMEENYMTLPPENESEVNYKLPLPDSKEFLKLINDFIEWHNQNQTNPDLKESTINSITALNQVIISKGVVDPVLAIHFIEQTIQSAFVPLTEVPVVYEYIKGSNYVPTNKKQTIKDKNGYALKPTDSDFDIAPMMKIINEAENETQFTDFNLDGNSQNIYFYAVREMDIKMNFGEFSDILGPVKLVAATAPKTPEIKRIMPILENQVLGIKPTIQIELNAYPPEHKVRKINIYRAVSMLDAQSIRTMKSVKEILISEETLSTDFDNVWTVYDDFEDLENIPFGDGLFYRITVSKQIEYGDPESTKQNPIVNIDYAPSQPSKITATVIVDNVSPESPVLEVSAPPTGIAGEILKPVVFSLNKMVHNGKYHLYKMNNQGNWEKLHEKASNETIIILPLQETRRGTDELVIKNEDGDRIYHHFKVISENSSGMFSSDEKILTL